MAPNSPCTRHTRVWIAACPDCTAWHLPRQRARRVSTATPQPTPPVAAPSPRAHPATAATAGLAARPGHLVPTYSRELS